MNSGYINEGGQLKSKNGQKYVINHRKPGVYVPRYCVLLTAFLGLAAMIVIALLTYFLVTGNTSASNGHQPSAALGNQSGEVTTAAAMAGLFAGPGGITQAAAADPPQSPRSHEIPADVRIVLDDVITLDDDFAPEVDDVTTEGIAVADGREDIVLADGWSPVLYKLLIEPDFSESISRGEVEIEVVADDSDEQQPLPPIVLDLNYITILNATVTSNVTAKVLPIETAYGLRNETFLVRVQRNDLPPNESLLVRLSFVSRLGDTLNGFYKTAYITMDNKTHLMASTQFSPVDARRAFPCFDRPDKKARFLISLVRHKNFTVAMSNMPSVNTTIPRPNYIRDDFAITPRMSTYLIGFAVSNLAQANVSRVLDGAALPDIRMWTRPEVTGMAQTLYTMTTRMLSFLEHYFDIKFTLPKIDMVAVPDFGFSAMENYGMITFRESKFLLPSEEEDRSVTHLQSVCNTLGHELAHQWFGNLVTMRWWNDLWLKEGFATYLSFFTIDNLEPSWQMMDFFSTLEMQPAMAVDSDASAHAISFPVNTSAAIRRMFDPISYSKGACMANMLNGILGDRTFRAGLKAYLKKYAYANAVQDDLWQIMTEQGYLHQVLPDELNIKTIMDTWTLQAGYPVVTVTRSPNNSDIVLTQHRFLLSGANTTTDPSLWFIPINFESQAYRTQDKMPTHWLANTRNLTIRNAVDPDHWVYLNIKRIGYYRVNYDYNSWIKLSKNFYDLPEITQGQLLDDSLQLARAQQLSYDIPLWLLMKLVNFDKFNAIPWAAASPGIEYLHNMLSREAANEHFQAYMKYILSPVFDYVGFQESSDDTHVQKIHRNRIIDLACRFGVERCVNRAYMLFKEWMLDPDNYNLSPNLKEVIFCTALRQGSQVEWQFAYERFLKTPIASEKEIILSALGCTSEPWLLSKYLNMSISATSGIRKQDGSRAFSAVARNPVGNELAFDFLSTNIEEISKYYGDGFSVISKLISATAKLANSQVQLMKFELFADKANKLQLTAIENSIRLTIPRVKNNVHWRQTAYNQLEQYLKSLIEHLRL